MPSIENNPFMQADRANRPGVSVIQGDTGGTLNGKRCTRTEAPFTRYGYQDKCRSSNRSLRNRIINGKNLSSKDEALIFEKANRDYENGKTDSFYLNLLSQGKDSVYLDHRKVRAVQQRALQQAENNSSKNLELAKTIAGRAVTTVTGAATMGIAQAMIDGKEWRNWALGKAEEWGWNESKFGQACGIMLSAASLAAGAVVGVVCGGFEGGEQAYQAHQVGQGVWETVKQSFSKAYHARQPTRFDAQYDPNNDEGFKTQASFSSTESTSAGCY